jgi:hypothetical protein
MTPRFPIVATNPATAGPWNAACLSILAVLLATPPTGAGGDPFFVFQDATPSPTPASGARVTPGAPKATPAGPAQRTSPTPHAGSTPVRPTPTPTISASDAATIAEFMKRVNAYVAIHLEAEKLSPKLPQEATPLQIDQNQRALGARIQAARAGAKRGDLFTPAMTAFITGVLNRVFAGRDGTQLRSSIMDENVQHLVLKVNQRYPDAIPRTTMPPDVLKALPELPEEMEYRFVGNQLILLDQHAHIIADFLPQALPGK